MKFYTVKMELGEATMPMKIDYDLFIDSDAFIGLNYEFDVHHLKSVELFMKAAQLDLRMVTSNLVIIETATVLSNRSGQIAANFFLQSIKSFEQVFVDQDMYRQALNLFSQQKSRGSSVVDCANVTVMKKYSIPSILSFDKAYKKQYGLQFFE